MLCVIDKQNNDAIKIVKHQNPRDFVPMTFQYIPITQKIIEVYGMKKRKKAHTKHRNMSKVATIYKLELSTFILSVIFVGVIHAV